MNNFSDKPFDAEYFEWLKENPVLSVLDLLRRESNKIRIRAFSPLTSRYYGREFVTNDSAYVIWYGCPYLITRTNTLWQLDADTELGWLTSLEVKLLSAISFSACSSSRGQWYRHHPLDKATSVDIPFSSRKRAFRIKNYFYIAKALTDQTRAYDLSKFPWSSQDNSFNLDTEWASERRSKLFYRSFDHNDPMLLRTAYLLLRAASLIITGNRMLAEAAAIYTFAGLEGTVRLICKKFVNKKDFVIKPTCEYIGKTFAHKPGYKSMVVDAYAQRNQVFHADSLSNSYWMPDLWVIDYLYAYAMANDFLYHIVTGNMLPMSEE